MSLISLGDGSTLSLDFTTGVLDSRISYTRSGTATFIGSNGLVQTANANQPRFDWAGSADYATLSSAPGLLIEPPKTNWLPHSETFATSGGSPNWVRTNINVISSNNTSPAGTTNALRIQATAVNATVFITSNQAAFLSGGRTFSVWIRRVSGSGNIGITCTGTYVTQTAVDGTWRRFSNSSTAATTNVGGIQIANANDTIEIWGAQLEDRHSVATVVNQATSYIPTGTSTASRSADDLVISGSAFTGLYNPQEGTFAVRVIRRGSGTFCPVSVNNNSSTEETRTSVSQTGASSSINVGGVNVASTTITGSTTAFSYFSTATAYRANRVSTSLLGANGDAALIGDIALPSVTQMVIGNDSGSRYLHGAIQRLRYYPYAMFDTQLINVTRSV